jgi:hypothetical protein
MWNFKTLKSQKKFQNWSRILEFQFKSFATHKWVKCTWCVNKNCSLLYNKDVLKTKNGYDLKLLSLLKMKH